MKAKLAICSSMKDEAEYLLEWLCFHHIVGIERFVLYNNEGTDESPEIIAKFNARFPGTVDLIDWPVQPGQWLAFSDMIENRKDVAEWVAFIDADEFLFGTEEDDLKNLLPQFEQYSGIGAHWLNFGPSGHKKTPPGLCIEAFTMRAIDEWPAHRHVKCVVKIGEATGIHTVHLMRTIGDIVTEKAKIIPPESKGRLEESSHGLIRINHYITKSHEQLRKKIDRGWPRKANDPGKHRKFEEYIKFGVDRVEDLTIRRFADRVKTMMAEVNAITLP